ncbi:putative lipoprotein [Dehalococcoides mccartyi]|uniref:Putative lipoprotein n=1 Tax=Dehalococcoides mccartyi TaxID=61435 RepID=A0A328EN65_9CHLR|nr:MULTISPECIES: hypothetical protein [Dehalococcoides]PKH45603.1 hypothetical protein KKB3_01002 [Dehalococcoides mccartyi]RAL68969.1 putative lipoprotein [Dehalococcoides mccartyi]RAL70153.1 putative lipoprotein [Dehalococcoides mccartyi]BAS32453.1 lipoprotein [Dehalococcoides mccartyi IBARAKI]
MKSRVVSLVGIFVGLNLLITGCTNEPSVKPPIDDICPDTYVRIIKGEVSAEIADSGLPVNPTDTFGAGTEVIILTYWITDEICCHDLAIVLECNGEIIFTYTQTVGESDLKNPDNIAFYPQQESGFSAGSYTAIVYLDISELIRVSFRVI